MNELSKIYELLGEKNVQKLKDKITDMLLNTIQEDLDNMGLYIIDFEELFDDIRSEVFDKIKDKMVEKYTNQIESKLENMLRFSEYNKSQ